jgi:hypothetical protein
MVEVTTLIKGSYRPRQHGGLALAHQGIDEALQPVKGKSEIMCFGHFCELKPDQLHSYYDSLRPSGYDCQLTISPHPKLYTPHWPEHDWEGFASHTMLGLGFWSHGWPDWIAIVRSLPKRPYVRVFFSSNSRLYRKDLKGMRKQAAEACEWAFVPYREFHKELERIKDESPTSLLERQMMQWVKEMA